MIPSELLRFKDLTRVGIRNWPTLKRRVLYDNFPPGRYSGSSRCWTLEEVEAWWENLPRAGAPPEIVKPAPLLQTGEAGRETEVSLHHPQDTKPVESAQALPERGGAR